MKDPQQLVQQWQGKDEPKQDTQTRSPQTTIELDCIGEHGKRWQGTFVYRVPNVADQMMIGRVKADYFPNGALADPNAGILNERISYLGITIKESPSWWKPLELYDTTPIHRLYEEVLAYARTFHGSTADDGKLSATAANTAKPNDDGAVHATGDAPVGRKVQPPAQRREVIAAHGPRGS